MVAQYGSREAAKARKRKRPAMEVAAAVKNGRNPQHFRSPEFSRERPSGDRKAWQNATPLGPLSVGTTQAQRPGPRDATVATGTRWMGSLHP